MTELCYLYCVRCRDVVLHEIKAGYAENRSSHDNAICATCSKPKRAKVTASMPMSHTERKRYVGLIRSVG